MSDGSAASIPKKVFRTREAVTGVMKVKEQSIAVFGERGSGKTVLLSSFFGAAQEPAWREEHPYLVAANDTGQGTRLRQNYLKMKNAAQAPVPDRFEATRYSFTIRPKERSDAKTARSSASSTLRLVWHDYPGEWFEEDPSSAEEATRRIETFTNLLQADVAVLLVDGQKLLDYAGDEEKYLKSLLWGLRDGLENLKDKILDDGNPLRQFPRIWVLALSKSDLHPALDVHQFQDLIIEKAAADVAALRETLQGFVQEPRALSIGEDYLLLSSAKFEPGSIEVAQRVGLDLMLPIACMLPLERVAQWAKRFDVPLKLLGNLVERAGGMATLLTASVGVVAAVLGRVPKVGPLLSVVVTPLLDHGVSLSTEKLMEIYGTAVKNQDYLTVVAARLRLDLDSGVQENLLVKSPW